MTEALEQAFAEAAKLSPLEQDLLASRLLAEIIQEDDFDLKIASTGDKLAILAQQALEEHRAGLSEELNPDQL